MFLIANKGRSEVALSDLGIILQANQAIDLHNVNTKIIPEKSEDLKEAARKGAIKILKKDKPREGQINQNITVNEGINKEQLLQELKDFVKQEIFPNQQKSGSDELREVINLLKQQQQQSQQNSLEEIKKMIANVSTGGNVSDDMEDIDIDEEAIAEMHAKAVNNRVEKMDGKIAYKKEKIEDDSIGNNADELGDLL